MIYESLKLDPGKKATPPWSSRPCYFSPLQPVSMPWPWSELRLLEDIDHHSGGRHRSSNLPAVFSWFLVGNRVGHFFESKIEIVGGIILIGIGIKILIQDLLKG